MVKKKMVIIPNMTKKEFEIRLDKVNRNYKDYKKEWCISVIKKKNIFTILASNKIKFVASSRGNFEEFMKIMKIKVTEQGSDLLLEKSFQFNLSQFILIKLIPNLSYFLFITNGFYIFISFILNRSINFWLQYTEFILVILALINIIWTKNSKNLEIERYYIIEEILERILFE